MTNELFKSSLILAGSILICSTIDRLSPDYHFEVHGDQLGFAVRSNKTNGDRCLLDEGAVRVMKDWYELAHVYPVPLKLCDDAKNNHIENPYLVKNLQSNVEGTHGMFDDLIPDKNKK